MKRKLGFKRNTVAAKGGSSKNIDLDDSNDFEENEQYEDFEEIEGSEENEEIEANGDDNETEIKSKKPKWHHNKDLKKPPTSQEINTLRETENLYHSSLFRLQVEELLKEVKLKQKDSLNEFLITLKEYLLQISPDSDIYSLKDVEWIDDVGYTLPFETLPDDEKIRFRFQPPTNVEILGGYLMGLTCKSNAVIDVGLKIPKSYFLKGDHLNYRYHRKRALYLLKLTHELRSCEIIDEMRFSHFNGDQRKPCVLLKPLGNLSKYTICLYPYISTNVFKVNKFIPTHSNIRSSWYLKDQEGKSSKDIPTPLYNSSILHDMLFEDNWSVLKTLLGDSGNIRDAVLLLKVWLHQREIDQGHGSINSFLIAMIVAYLLKIKKLNDSMSSYQIVRTTWLYLTHSKWDTEGISLCDNHQNTTPSLEDYHAAFDVVFIDSSGYLNLFANVSKITYLRLKNEAELSIKILDSSDCDSFDSLFMSPLPFVRKFDHFIILEKRELMNACEKLNISTIDYHGNPDRKIITTIIEFLQNGMSKRIQLIDFRLSAPLTWDLTDNFTQVSSTKFIIGLLLDPNYCHSLVDKGPQADNVEALKFREFWGEKSDMRRFQDSSICEAVVWPGSTIADKRNVCKNIATYILTRHVAIAESSILYMGTELEGLTGINNFKTTADEQSVLIIKALEALGKDLRKLDLELLINDVQGISPVFRYTEVFPPAQYSLKINPVLLYLKNGFVQLKTNHQEAPFWLRPIEVILHLETSNKWPEDVQAIRYLKTAFHIRLGEMLKQHYNLTCLSNVDYVDVLKEGYIFRFVVYTPREITALKLSKTPLGMIKLQECAESISLEMKMKHLPLLTSSLHGLQMQHSVFGATCRLAKRWIYSQLLWDHVNDVTIELLVAFLFTNSSPFTPPSYPQVGFLRFLQLLHSFDWKNTPLIVNLNGELKKEEVSEIRSKFISSREQLPCMFIATPYDKFESVWTKQVPIPQVLYRLRCLAKETQKVLEQQFLDPQPNFDYKVVFRPPLDPYDVIIHLNLAQVPTINLAVDKRLNPNLKNVRVPDQNCIPLIDYNPVMSYITELKAMFGEMALFFYDYFGGTYIAVLWKPASFQYQPFKVSTISGKMIAGDVTKKPVMVTPNTAAIIEEFSNIGQGLVKSITTKSQNWTFAR